MLCNLYIVYLPYFIFSSWMFTLLQWCIQLCCTDRQLKAFQCFLLSLRTEEQMNVFPVITWALIMIMTWVVNSGHLDSRFTLTAYKKSLIDLHHLSISAFNISQCSECSCVCWLTCVLPLPPPTCPLASLCMLIQSEANNCWHGVRVTNHLTPRGTSESPGPRRHWCMSHNFFAMRQPS